MLCSIKAASQHPLCPDTHLYTFERGTKQNVVTVNPIAEEQLSDMLIHVQQSLMMLAMRCTLTAHPAVIVMHAALDPSDVQKHVETVLLINPCMHKLSCKLKQE